MESFENGYCRLCGEIKSNAKLQNLQTNKERQVEIIKKLNRVNALVDFTNICLPETVCCLCVTTLDTAFAFVLAVEQAQMTLYNLSLAPNIKKEVDDLENYIYSCDSPDVKDEDNINVKMKTSSSDTEEKTIISKSRDSAQPNKALWNLQKNDRSRFDAIPLSQLKLTWRDYSWICAHCETRFFTIDELRVHSIQYHKCCNPFRCTDCNVRKLNLDSFLIHIKRHRKFLKLSCYKCFIKFTSLKEGREHKNEHISSGYVCRGCNTSFINVHDLKYHTDTFYKDKKIRVIPKIQNKNSLTCVFCKKIMKSKSNLSTHLLIHTERKREYICEICGKCFLHKHSLLAHMPLHKEERPYKCKICKCSFKTIYYLRTHVGTHAGEKPFACEQCGRCFRLRRQLKSHLIIHTDSLPHVCSYCNKAFRFKTILDQHLRQHTGVKPYSCDLCHRDFTNWPNFNKHMKRRHGMDMAKKKHTPDGVYPVNPTTGKLVIFPETDESLEWKRNLMVNRNPGRPKHPLKKDIKTNIREKN